MLKSKFFSHRECEFFPCHATGHPEDFNCLFCYCPLYPLGDKCRGNFTYTPTGVKDCSPCMVPHGRESYDYIAGRFREIDAVVRRINGAVEDPAGGHGEDLQADSPERAERARRDTIL